ncbi:MAG: restriction endonuclease subunit S, partial [Synechococcus sp.]|nr:restriction endonuclease subunit S [Synechococcus sp.]
GSLGMEVEWTASELGDLTINFDGKRKPVKESDRRPGPYPYYGASGIVDHVDDFLFDGDYLLIAEDGENLRTRQTPIAFMAKGKFWVNNHAHIVLGNDKADTRFLMYALQNADISGYLTGAVMPKLTQGNLNQIEISHPCIIEQRAIAHILGTLDDKIELNRRMSETFESMARALFKSWFIDFDPVRAKMAGRETGLPPEVADLFPDRLVESESGALPAGWSVQSIYSISDVVYGAPFASNQFNTNGVGDRLIRIRDLASEMPSIWTTEEHPKGYRVRPGDIVVGMDGEFRAYLWGGIAALLNQRVCVFKPRNSYSAAFVRNSIIPLLNNVEATEIATTVIHLGKTDIDRFRVIVPESELLAAFNWIAQPWYVRIVEVKQESRVLADLRDTLLPKLITGELRIRDAEKFVESVA